MSVIFPTEPPSAQIHFLPKNSQFITYRIDDVLTLSAWMPDGFQSIDQPSKTSDDDFHYEFCEECHRNCSSFLNDLRDASDEIDWSDVPGGESGHCYVYNDGYHGQHCPEGNVLEDDDITFHLSSMVFEIKLNHLGEPPRYKRQNDSAYLKAGKLVGSYFYSTGTLSASNVFGSDTEPLGICWGRNSYPNDLREIVTNYFLAPFNNDLLPLSSFRYNCTNIRHIVAADGFRRDRDNIYLCSGEDADALMFVDAEQNISAFFTLLSAGFTSLPEAPHLMLVPIKETSFIRNGAEYRGYQTISDAVQKNWYVTDSGLLVGQI